MAKKTAVTEPTQPQPIPEPPVAEDRKRGWKKEKVLEIHAAFPSYTHQQIAVEFESQTGETVSLPSVGAALRGDDSPSPKNAQPTIFDLQEVFDWCDENKVGTEKLQQQVEAIAVLANKVGGFDALAAILKVANRIALARAGK